MIIQVKEKKVYICHYAGFSPNSVKNGIE